jgi:hypothetical protein
LPRYCPFIARQVKNQVKLFVPSFRCRLAPVCHLMPFGPKIEVVPSGKQKKKAAQGGLKLDAR